MAGGTGFDPRRLVVRGIRDVVHLLRGPAPRAIADLLSAEEVVSSLDPRLESLEFSPFAALPGEPAVAREPSAPKAGDRAAGSHAGTEGVAHQRSPSMEGSTPGRKRSGQTAERMQGGGTSAQHPTCFLLSRDKDTGETRAHRGSKPPVGVKGGPGGTQSHGLTYVNTGSGRSTGSADGCPLVSEAEPEPGAVPRRQHAEPEGARCRDLDSDTAPEGRISTAMTLMNDLDNALLRRLNAGIRDPVSEMGDLPCPPQIKPFGSKGLPPWGSGPSTRLMSGTPGSESHRGRSSNDAVSLIGALADSLLGAGASPKAVNPPGRKQGKEGSPGGAQTDRTAETERTPAIARTAEQIDVADKACHRETSSRPHSSHAFHRSAVSPGMDRDAPEPERVGPECRQHLYVDTLAALVNDALVSQARRHGVDMS